MRDRIEDYSPLPWPEDFGDLLEGLKKLAGVSWREMAGLLGLTNRGALKWRRGGRPSAANLLAIMELARDIPGGSELMVNGDSGAADDHQQ